MLHLRAANPALLSSCRVLPGFSLTGIPVLFSLALSLALASSGICNPLQNCNLELEARVGIEPTHRAFAEPCLTTWLPRRQTAPKDMAAPRARKAKFPGLEQGRSPLSPGNGFGGKVGFSLPVPGASPKVCFIYGREFGTRTRGLEDGHSRLGASRARSSGPRR